MRFLCKIFTMFKMHPVNRWGRPPSFSLNPPLSVFAPTPNNINTRKVFYEAVS